VNAQLNITVFGWRIATFDLRLDIDQAAAVQQTVDGVVKKLSRRWTARMTS
jgi:hypothetical protein